MFPTGPSGTQMGYKCDEYWATGRLVSPGHPCCACLGEYDNGRVANIRITEFQTVGESAYGTSAVNAYQVLPGRRWRSGRRALTDPAGWVSF